MLPRIIILKTFCVSLFILAPASCILHLWMKRSFYIAVPGPAFPATKGELWPKPQQQIKNVTYYKLSPEVLKFTVKGKTCDILKAAIERYTKVLRTTHHIAWKHSKKVWKHVEARSTDLNPDFKGSLQELQINLTAPCEAYPYSEMNEKYSLNVSAVSSLDSDSIWGILRGMESFSQLFYMTKGYTDVLINATQIVDFPRYTYRGLLIDTSRHYLSVESILKTLDAMEMNKMNVLHWHIVDDQSFPYQSEKLPELSLQGAYDPSMVYTETNINQIVNYARDRGIRVIPEFDVPAHTRSWGVAYPSILTECYKYGEVVGLGPMDPSNNDTYKLIGELFHEVQERFPDRYFHLGGDEVSKVCWSSNPDIHKFMKEHNMTKPNELHAYFMTKVISLLGQKSKPIVWQEVFYEGAKLPSDAIVQVWKSIGARNMLPILFAGHKLIYSASWYLDYLGIDGHWTKFYRADPRQMIPRNFKKLANLNNILGGEACMWGESVDDRNLISRVWPRASAVAEKLWSANQPQYKVAVDVSCRLEEHTCRMNRRGVHAQPPNGPGFCID